VREYARTVVTAETTSSTLEYLLSLYEMAEEGIPTTRARLAAWMGVTRPSVSGAVQRLARDGLLDTAQRELRFTAEGERTARSLARRHRLAEHFLIRVIGLPWHRAHEEAGRWERVISDEVEERMTDILGDPATCPHGNPIPGSARAVDLSDLVTLQAAPRGREVVLRRLTEDLELDLDVMRFLEESGLMPGARIRVEAAAPDGTLTLSVNGRRVGLGANLADHLWVRPGR
jgi:DtxR family transcriptional regulator, Mn-dependent transcriptional regulator